MIFKFYLHPALVPDMQFAKAQLPKYVADMNSILAKNTSRVLEFDPDTGIILTETKPHTDTYFGTKPLQFEIWAHAEKFPGVSNNGYAGIDQSGAGVLAGLRWNKLHDPDNPADWQDYCTQLHFMLHELGHVFGAGMGEYYGLMNVTDTSPSPSASIDIADPSDVFWSARSDWLTDPLLRNAAALPQVTSRAQYLAYVQYNPLTAHVVSGDYRNGLPNVPPVLVTFLHNGAPLRNARVRVWRVDSNAPHAAALVSEGGTDTDGQFVFGWGLNPRSSAGQLHFVKVYKGGYAPRAMAVSIHDADREYLMQGMPLVLTLTTVQQATFADVPTSHYAWKHIEAVADLGITNGCGGGNFCPTAPVTREQLAVWFSKALDLT